MTAAADSPWPGIVRQAWDDLQPFPRRFGLTWRVALLCALVAATAMVLKIPESAISCYLIIFLMKQDAVMNCLMGVGLILLATMVVALMIPVINLSIDSPPARISIMFAASYVFLFLSSTTPLGEQAAIVGLIIAFIMTLVTDVPVGAIGNEGLLAAWKMACMPMALMVLFNLILGVPAQTHVRETVVARLRRAAERIDGTGRPGDFDDLLGEGNDVALQRMMLVKILNLVPKARAVWLNGAVDSSYRVLVATDALGDATPEVPRRDTLAARLRACADQIETGEIPAASGAEPVGSDPALRALDAALGGLSRPDGGGAPKPRMIPILAPDAFSNPDHQRYAMKTSIAAVLCYLIYTGIQWDGIHTAMITCYVAALGSTGETVRKLTLRITGCLIGAAMGWFTLGYVMPGLSSVGGLMVMVFTGVFIGAWVSSGPERIYYAGVQIALAFLLTTLNGFGPSFEISQATGRIWGILLGIFVIYVIFTQFWPRGVIKEALARFSDALDALARLGALPATEERARTEAVSAAQIALARAGELLDTAPFEPTRLRAPAAQVERLEALRVEMRGFAARLFLADTEDDEIARRLRAIRVGLSDAEARGALDTSSGSGPAGETDDHDDLDRRLARLERIARV